MPPARVRRRAAAGSAETARSAHQKGHPGAGPGRSAQAGWQDVYVAICVWLFSASWSYDLYLLLRDGRYPITWAANIGASSVLYAAAGFMWNLSTRPGAALFAFRDEGWPQPDSGVPALGRMLLLALPWMLLVAALLLPFLLR